ncbi:MAG TPA: HAD family hydrolase [Holophagaceae bacterium]|nr:HAD family hydrolase [Holophagaceae bacterium]
MIRAVVFDLWNTLVKSRGGSPFYQMRALLRLDQASAYADLARDGMTRSYPSAAAFLAGWRSRLDLDPAQEAAMEEAFRRAGEEAERFPESLEALAGTRELARLGLLSNTQSFDLGLMDRLDLSPYFRIRGLSAELGALKPEAAAFEAMQRRLGLFPGDLVMVGDSWTDDVEGALAAGWTAIWVNREGRPRPDHDPDAELLEVADLSRVPEAITGLQAGARCSTCLG